MSVGETGMLIGVVLEVIWFPTAAPAVKTNTIGDRVPVDRYNP